MAPKDDGKGERVYPVGHVTPGGPPVPAVVVQTDGTRHLTAVQGVAEGQHVDPAQLLVRTEDGYRPALRAGNGPAQVATEAYRANYETLFGKRQEAGQA